MLRAALLTLLILVVLPATASAACRSVDPEAVWYDSPVVQVWGTGGGFASCDRATGTEHVYDDAGPDPEARLAFSAVRGDRWLTLVRQKGYESDDSSIEYLGSLTYDTWTGEPYSGWSVSTGADGIVLHRADGGTVVVDAAPVSEDLELVYQGRRVYWRTPSGPRTALLELPATAPLPRVPPLRARRMTNCTPRPGANLLVRYRRVVVTRKGRSTHVCFNGRVTPIGNVRRVSHLAGPFIAYARPGYVGQLDANRGRPRELPSAAGPIAASFGAFAAVDRAGTLRVWPLERKRPLVVARGGATDVAVTYYDIFWMAPDGTPRVRKH